MSNVKLPDPGDPAAASPFATSHTRETNRERRDAPTDDDLLAQLRGLPTLAPEDRAVAARHQRESRAAFVRAFEDEPWYAKILAGAGIRRAAVPLVLAGVVGVYMHWAVGAAMKLMQ